MQWVGDVTNVPSHRLCVGSYLEALRRARVSAVLETRVIRSLKAVVVDVFLEVPIAQASVRKPVLFSRAAKVLRNGVTQRLLDQP